MRQFFVKVDRELPLDGVRLIIGYREDKKYYILHGEDFEEYKLEDRIVPTLFIPYIFNEDHHILTQIVDGLIEQGAKPSKPIKNNEELEAIKYHLEDMRKLIFKINWKLPTEQK